MSSAFPQTQSKTQPETQSKRRIKKPPEQPPAQAEQPPAQMEQPADGARSPRPDAESPRRGKPPDAGKARGRGGAQAVPWPTSPPAASPGSSARPPRPDAGAQGVTLGELHEDYLRARRAEGVRDSTLRMYGDVLRPLGPALRRGGDRPRRPDPDQGRPGLPALPHGARAVRAHRPQPRPRPQGPDEVRLPAGPPRQRAPLRLEAAQDVPRPGLHARPRRGRPSSSPPSPTTGRPPTTPTPGSAAPTPAPSSAAGTGRSWPCRSPRA